MNPKVAAQRIIIIVDGSPERDDEGVGTAHALWMLEGITLGYIQHEKAHRWLGYAQGILVMNETATLDNIKQINARSGDEDKQ